MLDSTISSDGDMELITFRVGQQEFCVDILTVREIRGWAPVTPLPRSPPFVRGVINLRGTVLPIIDLAQRLGLPGTEPTERHAIIVAQIARPGGGPQVIGLSVDGVSDILTASHAALQSPPDIASSRMRSFVQGLLAIDDRMLSLLSLELVVPAEGGAVEAAAA